MIKRIHALLFVAIAVAGCAGTTQAPAPAPAPATPSVAPRAAPAPAAPARQADSRYTVVRGDSLWGIAERSAIYGDAYQWPLIYRANRDTLADADLIHPGQVLNIDRNASNADINAAVQHARTRGAWTLGVAEKSDRAYLAESDKRYAAR